MTNISTLRPGLLVSLKTSLTGNVKYATVDLEQDHLTADGQKRARWETTRVVVDPAEHEAAVVARGKARSLITAVCAQSAFGLLCPQSGETMLTDAITTARQVINDFNARAALTQVSLYVIVGRVAADDVEAISAINSEIRDLIGNMESGLRNLDVKEIRAAANKLRSVSAMLSPDAAKRAGAAIEAARSAARRIVAAGETAAIEIDRVTLETLRGARTAFLDLDDVVPVTVDALPAAGRAVDFDAMPVSTRTADPAPVPSFEF